MLYPQSSSISYPSMLSLTRGPVLAKRTVPSANVRSWYQGTLVYVVVGGCGLKGVVDWSVEGAGPTRIREDNTAQRVLYWHRPLGVLPPYSPVWWTAEGCTVLGHGTSDVVLTWCGGTGSDG
eukprot:1851813-Rhodomonas_salina.1